MEGGDGRGELRGVPTFDANARRTFEQAFTEQRGRRLYRGQVEGETGLHDTHRTVRLVPVGRRERRLQVGRVPAGHLHGMAGREGDGRGVVVDAPQIDQHPERPRRQPGICKRHGRDVLEQRQHAGRLLIRLRLQHLERGRSGAFRRIAVLPEDHRDQGEDSQQRRHRTEREHVQRARGQPAVVGFRLQERERALQHDAPPTRRVFTIGCAR